VSRGKRKVVRSVVVIAAAMVLVSVPTAAGAASGIKLRVGMEPEKLGQSTTVNVSFEIPTQTGQLPSALTELDVLLPAGMGLASSGLGLETCSTEILGSTGPSSCPADSLMGRGSAVAEAMLGSQVVSEGGPISTFLAQPTNGRTTLLYYFGGKVPVIAPLIFPSLFFANGNSPRSQLQVSIPLIPVLPGTPDAAIVDMHTSVGPRGVTYYKHSGKKVVRYKPIGMQVPPTCPKGGFPFSIKFAFEDGSQVTRIVRVPCP
jgi:hypothetical protein